MATFTSNHPELLETRDKMIFFKQYTAQPQVYPQLFESKASTKAFEDRMRVAGLGRFSLKPEGTPVAFSDPISGPRRRTVHSTYALGYRVTKEAVADDQWATLNKMPSDLGDSANDHRERVAWALVNDGFAGATFTGLDGVALFSTAHVSLRTESTVLTNILSPAVALSVSGLEAVMTMSRTTDSEEGRFVQLGQRLLVIHPALEHTAYTLLESQFKPGSADNDVSTVVSTRSGLKPVLTPYKSSTTNWSVHDAPGKNTLQWNNREDVSFDQSRDAVTFDMLHFSSYRASVMFSDWRGNFGSNS